MSEIDEIGLAPEKIQQLLESQLQNLERAKKLSPKYEEQVEKKRKQCIKDVKQTLKSEKLTTDQKLNNLKSNCLSMVEEVAKLELDVAREVTVCEGIKVHRDKLLKDYNKSEALCTKLQQLCRELQKQNSSIIEKAEKSCKQEASIRDSLKEEFQEKLDAISEKVTQQGQEKEALLVQNTELQQKLTDILQGYSQTESQVQKFCEAREAEKQLANLQLEQQSQICQQREEEASEYKVKYENMKKQCESNREELEQYRSQYDNIQNVVNDAKQMVNEAAIEKEKTAKMYAELTKERNQGLSNIKELQDALSKNSNTLLKQKLDNQALLKKLQSVSSELEKASNQRDKFADLCRVMQQQMKVAKETLTAPQDQ